MSLLLATLLLPVTAGAAAQPELLPLPQLVAAFRSICLERIADAPEQTRVATGAPWNFKASGAANRFESDPAWLYIDPKSQTCAVTSPVPAEESVESTQTALANIVPVDGWKPLPDAGSRYVLIALDNGGTEFVISFKVSNKSGRNLVTLSVAKR